MFKTTKIASLVAYSFYNIAVFLNSKGQIFIHIYKKGQHFVILAIDSVNILSIYFKISLFFYYYHIRVEWCSLYYPATTVYLIANIKVALQELS